MAGLQGFVAESFGNYQEVALSCCREILPVQFPLRKQNDDKLLENTLGTFVARPVKNSINALSSRSSCCCREMTVASTTPKEPALSSSSAPGDSIGDLERQLGSKCCLSDL